MRLHFRRHLLGRVGGGWPDLASIIGASNDGAAAPFLAGLRC
jgi:hypothetical protein